MRWTCKKIELFLDDYLEGELSVRDTFTYEAHVETCPGCRKYVDGMAAFVEKFREQIGPASRARTGPAPQRVLNELSRLPIGKQFLLAEAIRSDLEKTDKRWKAWKERARKRKERATPN